MTDAVLCFLVSYALLQDVGCQQLETCHRDAEKDSQSQDMGYGRVLIKKVKPATRAGFVFFKGIGFWIFLNGFLILNKFILSFRR